MAKEIRKCGQPLGPIKWYEIGGQEFYQQTLAIGQAELLIPYLHGASFEDLQAQEVLDHLGEKIVEVLQIVLIPSGITAVAHVMELFTPGAVERKDFFRGHLNHYDFMHMVEDFFACNLDSSLMTLIRQGPQAFLNQESPGTPETTMNGSVPSSPAETLATAMPSGD
ncbi:MAG: hypothetical protein OEQ18_02130 [Gammaproteobacteria bacterium]|nr:hypothetical protein [Gammaproteobacteria bacterium]